MGLTPYVKSFNTWNEFVDFCDNAPTSLKPEQRQSRLYHDKDISNWNGVLKLAAEGWPKGLEIAKGMSNVLFDHVSAMIERTDVNHDVEGHMIDIARFVDGEPECWLKFENVIQEAESGHRLIRITFNSSVSGMVGSDIIIRKGAAIVALIELLEYAGHRVELTLCDSTAQHRDETAICISYVKLKEFDQNVDLSKIAYALAHPSVGRGLQFAFMETAPEEIIKACRVGAWGSYGTPCDIPKESRGDIHIGHALGGEPQWYTPETTEKWVIEQLEKQGIHLKKEIK